DALLHHSSSIFGTWLGLPAYGDDTAWVSRRIAISPNTSSINSERRDTGTSEKFRRHASIGEPSDEDNAFPIANPADDFVAGNTINAKQRRHHPDLCCRHWFVLPYHDTG